VESPSSCNTTTGNLRTCRGHIGTRRPSFSSRFPRSRIDGICGLDVAQVDGTCQHQLHDGVEGGSDHLSSRNRAEPVRGIARLQQPALRTQHAEPCAIGAQKWLDLLCLEVSKWTVPPHRRLNITERWMPYLCAMRWPQVWPDIAHRFEGRLGDAQ